ncbi:conserved hypothetical protein [Lodderomyces elongisporus NRRL YB-4239]|uniref:Vitamin B6 transporter TPN1 n=1 Tax=Lodderomyces elongisporus (strain ATCC 11503 / CBS 2605 / JCM 1781 / NBRC 1676 / NRRL YB-4239) TaxID=379508 RepID=A5E6X3_LODEL|nr:conserved hypothetical protein [Lodderomyces elongisporus NRRL YB-4239]
MKAQQDNQSIRKDQTDFESVASTEQLESLSYHKFSKYIKWIYQLDSLGIETRGIERVSPEEREEFAKSKSTTIQLLEVVGLWWAACGGLTSMSSFFLPTLLFSLNLKDSLVCGLISMNIGCLAAAYCSTMGPKSGCRQMVTARFIFGEWGVIVVAVIAIVGGIGWSVVNCVLGGQILLAMNHSISLSVGIVVVAIISLVVAVFGIKFVLRFQTLLSIPIFVSTIFFYVDVCKKIGYVGQANSMIDDLGIDKLTWQGNWLSFFAIGYSVTATWGSCASDYYILFPESTSSTRVFFITFLGIAIPTTLVAIPATICGTIAYSYGPWLEAYNRNGVGELIFEAFDQSKALTSLLFLSLITNNIMNTYSVAFEFQLINKFLVFVPRWVWATLVSVIYIVLSLVGKEHFSTILSNFLPMLGYWISMYIALLLEENLFFRSTVTVRKFHEREFEVGSSSDSEFGVGVDGDFGQNLGQNLGQNVAKDYGNGYGIDASRDSDQELKNLYNWKNWNRPNGRTMGIAACIAFCCGVAGAVVGMNQVYYRGPLAAKIGEYGGDLGMFLAFGFTGITYPCVRYLELKRFKR